LTLKQRSGIAQSFGSPVRKNRGCLTILAVWILATTGEVKLRSFLGLAWKDANAPNAQQGKWLCFYQFPHLLPEFFCVGKCIECRCGLAGMNKKEANRWNELLGRLV